MGEPIKEKCVEDCPGFTGELWTQNPEHKDLFICCVSGFVDRPFYMPTPHAVRIGDECKFSKNGEELKIHLSQELN